MQIVEIADIIEKKEAIHLIDVRSEGEFLQGHIPWSFNVPLLNNEERAKVGTCYKEQGNEAAVLLGYELVGGKFADLIKHVRTLCPDKKVMIHCWRGGLRSRIVAQLLENSGFDVFILKEGYKSYRKWVLELFELEMELNVIGGLTGSGKTDLLYLLQKAGEQIIDLEGLAHHKGSAFGGINQPAQPTQEQFENSLAMCIYSLVRNKTIWIEDESRRIGNITVPKKIWETIRDSKLYEIEVPFEDRLNRILNEYATLPVDKLREGSMNDWAMALLDYYDKNYTYGQNKRLEGSRHKIKLGNPLRAEDFLSYGKG
jgi:tRNA 2-selenouridine synthase